ncbi:hypothetical protein [Caballeronia insecticola]|uniref:DUF4402 domain-containing protein n=1 Tax=Caballeronia insecticola TaxID=758793 RepID=R4WNJ6_9BURK|nr:hypothetical protein [Caballeronia insecticola]BAN22450.1 putative uncharacterized protein [Caballeronia insecticola]
MHQAKLRGASLAGRIALMGATVYCSVAAAASGGVIYFTGALVAPPFDVSVGPTAGSGISTSAQTRMTDTSGRTTYVNFLSDAHDPPNAELQLSANARAVVATFRDGRGQLVKPDAGGKYHVGALGGTLSMRANDGASPSETRVTLTTTYR